MSVKEIISSALTEVTDVLLGARKDHEQSQKKMQEAKVSHARLRETLEAKIREREHVRAAPAPDVELDASAARIVHEEAEWWLREYGPGLVRRLSGQLSSQELSGRTETTMERRPNLPVARNEAPPHGLLCALDPEGMTAKWVALIRRIPRESGAPMAERPALLSQLDAEIEELKAVEDELARDLGVPRRDEMVQREHTATRAAERAEQKRKDAEWLEEQKKAGHLGTPTIHHATMHPDRARDRR
jgi:hypothetical protein